MLRRPTLSLRMLQEPVEDADQETTEAAAPALAAAKSEHQLTIPVHIRDPRRP
jgi:hypothetical protein